MTTSIRSGSTDGALQLNGVDQITMQATQVLLAKPIAAPVGATGQLVTFDQVGGLGQTWQSVTRLASTSYTNTTLKQIVFTMLVTAPSVGNYLYVTVGGVISAVVGIPVGGQYVGISAIIPPGASYMWQTTGGIATVYATSELR